MRTAIGVLGIVVVSVGLALVLYQQVFTSTHQTEDRRPPTRRLSASIGSLKLGLTTTFPGLVVIAFGIVIIVVGRTA